MEFSLISSALSQLQKSLPMYYVCEVSSLTRNLVSDSYIYLLNTKMRLTMLCSNGFELYSRWLPLVSVWLRSKKRGTRVKDRVKNGAHIVVGTPHQELARIFRFIGWKKISFRILYVLISYYMYFVSIKGFLAGSARPVKNKKTN